jgi:predicted PurR-regulated permease PerM
MPKKVEISHRTIVFVFLFVFALWFLYFIRDIILQLFVALFIMTVLNPSIKKLTSWKIPRALAVIVIYLLIFALLGLVVAGVVPPLVEQSASFAANLPQYLSTVGVSSFVSQQLTGQLISSIGSIPGQIIKVGVSIFSNVLSVLAVIIFSLYLLMSREKLDEQLGFLFGEERKKEIGRIIDRLEVSLGGWARGELALMLLVGTANYIGLTLLGIPYALPLAILAGLLEIIPYLGPITAAIPAVIIGLSISPVMGLAAATLALLIQQIENYLLVPKIMEKSIGVSPLITLVALAIGFRLAGVVGAIIAVPATITLQVLASEYILSR